MMLHDWPTVHEIGAIFAEEITAAGGQVTESIAAEPRLFARSVLPGSSEVTRGDRVQAGVALRATDELIQVHPYVFRQVCSNGAIRAHALESRQILRSDLDAPGTSEVTEALREAIQSSCRAEAFAEGVNEMRAARFADADMLLMLISQVKGLPEAMASRFLESIVQQYEQSPDRSSYGLMNAVTAVARETRNPEWRWSLETIGGGVPVMVRDRSSTHHRGSPRSFAAPVHA